MTVVIGLTGGIGSGKSTVARILRELGAAVIDADAIVHELQAKGQPMVDEIAAAFGPGVLTADGALDRKALGAIVFRDETARARLALMRETNDGFRIAEEDLRLRGAGELLGTRQSGEAMFRLATPELLSELLPAATDDARLLIDRDGGLNGARGQAARTALYLFERDAGVALLRSG